MFAMRRILFGATLLFALSPQPASAAETVTYTYDALGRVTKVTRQRGGNNAATANYTYDHADNRSNVSVSVTPAYVVVPLNGYTLVKIR